MIKIIKPGLLTSIQDLGRYGFQKYGVITSGAMDQYAHRISNLLVGNQENESTLELTLLGPTIGFEKDALISICGANLSATINGEPVRLWRTVFVKQGSELQFGLCKAGCRAYVSVAGGFEVPKVMGSKSTYLRAAIGGFDGRQLKAGDRVEFGALNENSSLLLNYLAKRLSGSNYVEMDWSAASVMMQSLNTNHPIRVIKGRQYDLFSKKSQELFFTEPFEITTQSDRMGYRIEGPILGLENEDELISEAVSFGTIQVPAQGNPIILLADRQTTEGYPKIGQIATVDLPYIAQLKPGDKVSFVEISHEEAQRLYFNRERRIQNIKHGIALKIREAFT